MPVAAIAALLVLGIIAFAGGAGAAPRRTAFADDRVRFGSMLRGLGVDPGRLSEADWRIIERAMSDMQAIRGLSPEEQGRRLRESASFNDYIRMMMARYPDIAPQLFTG